MRTLPFLIAQITIAALLLTTGCATMRDSTIQPVLINSTPPGATIYVDGEAVGQTPTFVDIPRSGRTRLTINSANGPIEVKLKKKYRWHESFWPNLVFWIGAPVGWTIDLLTGTAYSYQPTEFPKLSLTSEDRRRARPHASVIAVAPPRSDEPALTDAGGEALAADLSARGGARVLKYHDTLPIFMKHGYDFDGSPAENARGPLYQRLDADVVYESTIDRDGARPRLKTYANHIFDRRIVAGADVELEPRARIDRWYTGNHWWSRLLPNLIALDLAATRIALEHDGKKFGLTPPEDEGFLAKSLDYLSAIKITSLPARRLERAWSWSLGLVPTIRASRRRVVAKSLPEGENTDQDTRYERLLIGAGYGPEFGVQSGRNYGYLDLLPMVMWTRIRAAGRSDSETSLQFGAEFGYIYYISSNWNVRIFTRTQNEDQRVWRPALADRLGDAATTATVTNLVSGFSVGYRFEPSTKARAVRR